MKLVYCLERNALTRWALGGGLALALVWAGYTVGTRVNLNRSHAVGDPLDELNGVAIYHNGGVNASRGRNLAADGYNLGIRYQCVEFAKRYYFERRGHRMPDTYGHAKDFFERDLPDGGWNAKRGMAQHANGGTTKPATEDLVVFRPWLFNPYGHVAVVASVGENDMEIAQQNPGPFGRTRQTLALVHRDGRWRIDHPRVLGWLRLSSTTDASGGDTNHGPALIHHCQLPSRWELAGMHSYAFARRE